MQDTLSHVMEVVGFAFVVGQQSNATVQSMLEEEASACDDILQIDMVDVYYNLSMKAAALLNWMKDDCRHADFLLKVDDDVYINWHNLTTIVSKLSPSLSTYYGIVGENLVVDRGYTWLNGKWRSSYESWPWRNHPNFTQGASVLMSGGTKSVYRLLAAAQTIPNYHLDDIYLWGVCAVKASLTFQQIDGIYTHKPNNDSCFISNHSSWLTESEEQMRYYDSVTRQFYASKIKCS